MIPCYLCLDDFARVKVTRVDMRDDDTDYINASYMDVCMILYSNSAFVL